jgi:hypothetical protein
MMLTGLLDFYPKILPSGKTSVICINKSGDHLTFDNSITYTVRIYPKEELGSHENPAVIKAQPVDGALNIQFNFSHEQEYCLVVSQDTEAAPIVLGEYHVYAVGEDLYHRRPYKGDFHMHSNRSDGQEPPAYVAASCRLIGLDFMAVTDHRQYDPSLEAIQTFSGLPIDLRIYPGEEIHPPDNAVHMINFGGSASINELFIKDELYTSEVNEIAGGLLDLPEGWLRNQYASCVWCYQKIRSVGGLGIFCHPYWVFRRSFNVPEALIARHFQGLPFDAFEVIGGYHRFEIESNRLQVARYYEERAQGKNIPIIGVSDAHGCDNGNLFGWYYTIVFSSSTDLPDLIRSIKDLFSIAVEHLPNEAPGAYGPFRLVKYAHFILREVMPLHDALCAEEGKLMLLFLKGSSDVEAALADRQGMVKSLYDLLWVRS